MSGKHVIGIDVGKSWLDVAAEGCDRVRRYSNDAAAIAALVEQLDAAEDLVVFERTGGWERNLEAALADRMIPWAVVHSQRVKAFRQVRGIKAKTDRIDARLLRDYGRDRLSIRKRRGLAPGRTSTKIVLFNPARTAMRFDPQIKEFCNRLRARGKPGKVIMVAVMRKMLVRLNAQLRDAMAKAPAAAAAR